MKKLLSLAVVSIMVVAASAQITWNAKAGLGAAQCYGGDFDGIKPSFVGKIAVGIEKPLTKNWSLMPSVELASKGSKYRYEVGHYEVGSRTLSYYTNEERTINAYVQVPIVAAYRMNLTDTWNTTFKAGPYFAYAFGRDTWDLAKTDPETGVESAETKKFDAGLDLGIDFERHRFVFGIEAEIGFMPLVKEDGVSGPKNLAFYATVGWKF